MAGRSRASRVIHAPREALYRAFLDPEALVQWMPPGDMTGVMHSFDGRVGGGYEMSLFYPAGDSEMRGKTAEREDRVKVRFVELVLPEKIVATATFDSSDPAYAGEMVTTILFEETAVGTRVTMDFENLPQGLNPADNERGSEMSLQNLDAYINDVNRNGVIK